LARQLSAAFRQEDRWASLNEVNAFWSSVMPGLREEGATHSFNAGNLKQIRVEMSNNHARAEHLGTPKAELP
jgi:hypothetical protein